MLLEVRGCQGDLDPTLGPPFAQGLQKCWDVERVARTRRCLLLEVGGCQRKVELCFGRSTNSLFLCVLANEPFSDTGLAGGTVSTTLLRQ